MMYSRQICWGAMGIAPNFAGNQVLHNFGFVHNGLSDSSSILAIDSLFSCTYSHKLCACLDMVWVSVSIDLVLSLSFFPLFYVCPVYDLGFVHSDILV